MVEVRAPRIISLPPSVIAHAWARAWELRRCPRDHCGGTMLLERYDGDLLVPVCCLCNLVIWEPLRPVRALARVDPRGLR